MRTIFALALGVACIAPHSLAQTTYRWDAPSQRVATRTLLVSQVAVLGATAADMGTSWHNRYELNPLLRSADGRFGHRGLVIKTALTGAWLGLQWIAHRRTHANARVSLTFASMNAGMSGVMAATAVRNARGRP